LLKVRLKSKYDYVWRKNNEKGEEEIKALETLHDFSGFRQQQPDAFSFYIA